MDKILMAIGTGAAALGMLLCLVAVAARLSGAFWLGSMQVGTWMQAGTAAMIAGCVFFLVVLTRRSQGGG
jgi:hypothetical protein